VGKRENKSPTGKFSKYFPERKEEKRVSSGAKENREVGGGKAKKKPAFLQVRGRFETDRVRSLTDVV